MDTVVNIKINRCFLYKKSIFFKTVSYKKERKEHKITTNKIDESHFMKKYPNVN
jgi:hypothetical protein